MRYTFELYILTDTLTPAHWAKFHKALLQYGGLLGKFELTVSLADNVARFFVQSDKDISTLSNNIDGLLLQPAGQDAMDLPTPHAREHLVQFVTGGNLLDVKEKYAVKKAKDLEFVTLSVRGLGTQKSLGHMKLYFKDAGGRFTVADKLVTSFPADLLAVNFAGNVRYLKKTVPLYLNIEKSLHMLTGRQADALFEIDTFPYFAQPHYLGLHNYEFDKHSLIIGATGTGKSKLISLLVDRLYRSALKMNYRVVIVDPHAALADDLAYIPDTKIVNFTSEGTELFAESAPDISAATELTATLFKSLLGDQFNARLDRTLRFSLYILFIAQNMSLDTLKRFLTDTELRAKVIGHVTGYAPQNIVQFFGSDFNEIRTTYYNESVLPIISLIDELQLQPGLTKGGDISLARTIQDNFLTIFSLNKVSMGEKTTKTVAGLLIQQLFLLAQARAFGQKIILIIDEVSIVQNPTLASILAEARKFNLSVILTQQYFGQIEKDLRAAIFANVYNYYVFKTSEEDARLLEGNLNMELPKEIADAARKKGNSETQVRVSMLSTLHPRECLIRVAANGQINPCVKARTVDAPVEAETANHIRLTHYPQMQNLPAKFVEGATEPVPVISQHQAGKTDAADGSNQNITQPKGFSIKDLLSAHSSSRRNVNKRKDTP